MDGLLGMVIWVHRLKIPGVKMQYLYLVKDSDITGDCLECNDGSFQVYYFLVFLDSPS